MKKEKYEEGKFYTYNIKVQWDYIIKMFDAHTKKEYIKKIKEYYENLIKEYLLSDGYTVEYIECIFCDIIPYGEGEDKILRYSANFKVKNDRAITE